MLELLLFVVVLTPLLLVLVGDNVGFDVTVGEEVVVAAYVVALYVGDEVLVGDGVVIAACVVELYVGDEVVGDEVTTVVGAEVGVGYVLPFPVLLLLVVVPLLLIIVEV